MASLHFSSARRAQSALPLSSSDARRFAEAYRTRVAGLDAAGMVAAVDELEKLFERTGRAAVYSHLLFAGDTADPKHGALLQELLDARDARGNIDRNATAALVELLEDTEAEVPADLSRLKSFLAGDEGLPEVELPDGAVRKLQTVEVSRQRVIVQSRGRRNELPGAREMDALRRWASGAELSVATYL